MARTASSLIRTGRAGRRSRRATTRWRRCWRWRGRSSLSPGIATCGSALASARPRTGRTTTVSAGACSTNFDHVGMTYGIFAQMGRGWRPRNWRLGGGEPGQQEGAAMAETTPSRARADASSRCKRTNADQRSSASPPPPPPPSRSPPPPPDASKPPPPPPRSCGPRWLRRPRRLRRLGRLRRPRWLCRDRRYPPSKFASDRHVAVMTGSNFQFWNWPPPAARWDLLNLL